MATVAFQADTSRMMIEQAADELANGDSLQACDKGWSAAAHAVKAIAEGRGWGHKDMADLFDAAHRLANEMGQPEIRNLFKVASMLHTNIYEGWLDDEDITLDIENVRRLLAMLDEVPG